MKFLVDAQLPPRLARFLQNKKCDALHTDDLPQREQTRDSELLALAERDTRVIITKDVDFLTSHTLHNKPQKLLLISTGNISNVRLLALFERYYDEIVKLFSEVNLVEIDNEEIIGHE